MPVCSVAPSGIERRDVPADLALDLVRAARPRSSSSGASTGHQVVDAIDTCTNESPCVRGMRGLTSAMTSSAASTAARTMSTETPRLT